MPVTKADLIKTLYGKYGGMSYTDTKKFVDLMLEHLKDGLVRDRKLLLSGFGTFEVVERKSRKGRNPKTGESLVIPARKTLVFQPSQVLTSRINGGGRAPRKNG
jgi:integration host factor subunit alpha